MTENYWGENSTIFLVIEDDEQYSLASIARFSKSRTSDAEGVEQSLMLLAFSERFSCSHYLAILARLYCWSPLATEIVFYATDQRTE